MEHLTEKPADEDWVCKAMNGDRRAFESLVRHSTRLVWSQLMLHTNDRDLADDLTQETFLRAWKKIATLESPEKFRAWIINIAHAARIDEHRHRARRKRTPSATELKEESTFPTPFETAEAGEQKSRAIAALKALPEQYQQPLAMRYLGGADAGEIERELNLSNGALRGLLHRGLAMLRETLNDYESA